MQLFALTFSLILGLCYAAKLPESIPMDLKLQLNNSKIIGGIELSANVPQFARIYDLATDQYLCGGTFLSSRVVVTAAHCIPKSGSFIVRYGSHLLADRTYSIGVIHAAHLSGYKEDDQGYDLGILLLNGRVPMGAVANKFRFSTIAPIAGESLYILGFGRTAPWDEGDTPPPLSPVLKRGEMVVISQGLCDAYMLINAERDLTRYPPGSYFCVAHTDQSTCYYDYGGPAYRLVNNQFFLVGVNTFGEMNCQLLEDTVYVTVFTTTLYTPHLQFLKLQEHYI